MLWSSSLLLLKRSVDGDQHFKLLCNLVTVFFLFPSDGRLFCTNRRGTIAVSISEMVLCPREFTSAPLRLNEESKT